MFWSAAFPAILAQGDQGVGIYSIFSWLGQQPHSTSSMGRLGQLYRLLTRCVPLGKFLNISEPRFLHCKRRRQVLPWLRQHLTQDVWFGIFYYPSAPLPEDVKETALWTYELAIHLHWFCGRENPKCHPSMGI